MRRSLLRLACALVAVASLCLATVTPLSGQAHCGADASSPASHSHHDPAQTLPPPGDDCPHCPPVQCASNAVCVATIFEALPTVAVIDPSAAALATASHSVRGPATRTIQPPTNPPLRSVPLR